MSGKIYAEYFWARDNLKLEQSHNKYVHFPIRKTCTKKNPTCQQQFNLSVRYNTMTYSKHYTVFHIELWKFRMVEVRKFVQQTYTHLKEKWKKSR